MIHFNDNDLSVHINGVVITGIKPYEYTPGKKCNVVTEYLYEGRLPRKFKKKLLNRGIVLLKRVKIHSSKKNG